jgi:sec-independent protein translocase protein TatA
MTEYTQYILAWTPGWMEVLIILVVALLIFGRRLPEIARGLGKSLTEFKKGMREVEDTKDEMVDEAREIKDDVTKEIKDATKPEDTDKDD